MDPATSFERSLFMLGTSIGGCLRPSDSEDGYVLRRGFRVRSAKSIGPRRENSDRICPRHAQLPDRLAQTSRNRIDSLEPLEPAGQ